MTTLYLIRHGETALNASRVFQPADTPLSERGLEQARRLGERLANSGIVRILVSDLSRAVMTAEAVAATTGAPLVQEPLLQERNFGALRGTPYADIDFDAFAEGYVPPEGESWEVFRERVARAWHRIRTEVEATPGPLAVVSHGLVCSTLVRTELSGLEADEVPRFLNTALTEIEPAPPWRIRRLGCTEHLAGMEDSPEAAPA